MVFYTCNNQIKIERHFICENPKCGKDYSKTLTDSEYLRYQKQKHFCSISCAHARIHTAESKAKTAKTLREKEPIDRVCLKCGQHYIGRGNGYCLKCNPHKGVKRHSCSLRQSHCLECGKTIYLKTDIDAYCEECYYNHPEYHHFQIYDANGKRVISAKTREKVSQKVNLAIQEGRHKGWHTRPIESYPEKFWKKVLENNGITYDFNFPIAKSSLGLEHESAAYFLDFALTGKIDLEIDGKQHKYPERILKDKERDELLTKNGWTVYRIEWNEISTEHGSKLMKEKIDRFLKWYISIKK